METERLVKETVQICSDLTPIQEQLHIQLSHLYHKLHILVRIFDL